MLLILPAFALVATVGVGLSVSGVVRAQQDAGKERLATLRQQHAAIVEDAKANNKFVEMYNQQLYAPEVQQKLRVIEDEMLAIKVEAEARPVAERAKTAEAINAWADKFYYTVDGLPRQELKYTGKAGGFQKMEVAGGVEIYSTADFEYTVDPKNNKVLDLITRTKKEGEPKWVMDMTARFSQDQLEQKARELVEAQNLGVDLKTLTLEKGQKEGTFFFVWRGQAGENKQAPSVKVGFTQGGQLIRYSNGFFEGL